MRNPAAETPLMQQYQALKERHKEEIVFFRLGDFYEMFAEDAERAAPILEVALTHRQNVPMCGVPYHAADRYMAKLLKKGFRVAIAEQLEDPSATKTLVKRDVTRIISNGTLVEENLLQASSNNYLAAVYLADHSAGYGISFLDLSTGEFNYSQNPEGSWSRLINEINILNPAEILISKPCEALETAFPSAPRRLCYPNETVALTLPGPNGWKEQPFAKGAVGMILTYLEKSNPQFLSQLKSPQPVQFRETMELDKETLESLEILKSLDGTGKNSLLEFLDFTLTSMGGRTLRNWLGRPLIHLDKIQARLEAVDFFVQENSLRNQIRDALKNCSDLERIAMRILTERASPRDLIHLKNSLVKISRIKSLLNPEARQACAQLIQKNVPEKIGSLLNRISDTRTIVQTIECSIREEPPATLAEGKVIKDGLDASLDEKREALRLGNSWLEALEIREKDKTNIPTLRLGFTSVFGYYLEVTKSHLSKVPPHWHRKQTLINTERFTNEELKKLEEKILGAEQEALRLEKALYQKVMGELKSECDRILETAQSVSEIDCLASFAEVAQRKGLTRPKWNDSDQILIREGWHPIVKDSLPSGTFVPNDTLLNSADHQIVILTGPNMAGKSTYLRQAALVVFMAQIGSYVSAAEAQLSLVDRIFTRIGSGDRLAQGQSTFMVEMRETSKILQECTKNSLIILDEVGRGTSTYDGISIAWAVLEHLSRMGPKVLFATHYFELTQLSKILDKVKNYNVEAKEWQDSVIFLHKISPGTADRSYGIHVAQLAGLPNELILRSKEILQRLEFEHKTLLELNRKQVRTQGELF